MSALKLPCFQPPSIINEREDLRRLHIASHDDGGVLRPVPPVEEVFE